MERMITCPECGGTGKEERCDYCHGSGRLADGSRCNACGGTGEGKECEKCHGNTWVWVDD